MFCPDETSMFSSKCRGRYAPELTNIANWKITMLRMGKLTISIAIFNSSVKLPKGKCTFLIFFGDFGHRLHIFVGDAIPHSWVIFQVGHLPSFTTPFEILDAPNQAHRDPQGSGKLHWMSRVPAGDVILFNTALGASQHWQRALHRFRRFDVDDLPATRRSYNVAISDSRQGTKDDGQHHGKTVECDGLAMPIMSSSYHHLPICQYVSWIAMVMPIFGQIHASFAVFFRHVHSQWYTRSSLTDQHMTMCLDCFYCRILSNTQNLSFFQRFQLTIKNLGKLQRPQYDLTIDDD